MHRRRTSRRPLDPARFPRWSRVGGSWPSAGRGRDPASEGAIIGNGAAATLRECEDCGRLQLAPGLRPGEALVCRRCDTELEHTAGRTVGLAFAFAAATVLMLAPANGLPLVRTWVLGASRESVLGSSVAVMLGDGWPEIAAFLALAVVALPFARYGLLVAVTGALVAGRRPPWLGRAFRWANALQPWAMIDVFLLAFLVAFWRLKAAVATELGPGGQCLIVAGVLALFTRAALDKAQVWRAILPDTPASALPDREEDAIACTGCELVRPAAEEGRPCPRCAAALRRRRPEAVGRALALILAGALLYLPANLLPLATLPIGVQSLKYTVLQGVIDLVQSHLLFLAAVVFTASFAIPILKLAGLSWCVRSVIARSDRRLRAKTWAYRLVEEVGRWSMVDPFVIAIIAPVMSYNAFITARAEPGAPFFTGVVIVTMLASRSFDPRRLWDAAEPRA